MQLLLSRHFPTTVYIADDCESVQSRFTITYDNDVLKSLYEEKIHKKEERQQKMETPAVTRFMTFLKKKYDIFKRRLVGFKDLLLKVFR